MLQLKCCILDTFMMPAGVRVRKHWWPQSKLSTLKTTTSANFNLANVYNFWNKTRYKIHVVKGRELLQPNQVPFQHGHLSFYLPPFHFVWWLFDSLAIFVRYTSFKFVFTKHDRNFFCVKERNEIGAILKHFCHINCFWIWHYLRKRTARKFWDFVDASGAIFQHSSGPN